MKLDPSLYNREPMSPRDIKVNLAKAAAIFSFAFGVMILGTEPFFGYMQDHYIIVPIIAIGCAVWGSTFFVRIGSGIFDKRHHTND